MTTLLTFLKNEDGLLQYNINKTLYASLGHYFNLEHSTKTVVSSIEEALRKNNQTEFLLSDGQKYTVDSLKNS